MRSASMKASPARLWDSDTALARVLQLSYIKVGARSAPWNAESPFCRPEEIFLDV
jgi:hypothetical protein